MKLGTFYEHQLPRPWKEGDELKLFQDALDQERLVKVIHVSERRIVYELEQ